MRPRFRTNPRNAESRHDFLVNRLVDSRNWQRATLDHATDIELYQRLLEPFVDLTGQFKLYEVLSDGLGAPDPHWDAAFLDGTSSALTRLPLERRAALNQRVVEERHRLDNLRYPTHRSLGRVLFQPCLFSISGTSASNGIGANPVQYFHEGQWLPLVENWAALPLKEVLDTSASSSSLSEAAIGLEESLQAISRSVIWRSFWREFNASEFLTLLYLQASSVSARAGVWALHIGLEATGRVETATPFHPHAGLLESAFANEERRNRCTWRVVTPPANCLIESLSLAFDHGGIEASRTAELRVLAYAVGYSAEFAEGSVDRLLSTIGEPAEELYHREPVSDPVLRHRHLLRAACQVLVNDSQDLGGIAPQRPDLQDENLAQFSNATTYGFAAIGLLLSERGSGLRRMTTELSPDPGGVSQLLAMHAIRALYALCGDHGPLKGIPDALNKEPKPRFIERLVAYSALAAALHLIKTNPGQPDTGFLCVRSLALMNLVVLGGGHGAGLEPEVSAIAEACVELVTNLREASDLPFDTLDMFLDLLKADHDVR